MFKCKQKHGYLNTSTLSSSQEFYLNVLNDFKIFLLLFPWEIRHVSLSGRPYLLLSGPATKKLPFLMLPFKARMLFHVINDFDIFLLLFPWEIRHVSLSGRPYLLLSGPDTKKLPFLILPFKARNRKLLVSAFYFYLSTFLSSTQQSTCLNFSRYLPL